MGWRGLQAGKCLLWSACPKCWFGEVASSHMSRLFPAVMLLPFLHTEVNLSSTLCCHPVKNNPGDCSKFCSGNCFWRRAISKTPMPSVIQSIHGGKAIKEVYATAFHCLPDISFPTPWDVQLDAWFGEWKLYKFFVQLLGYQMCTEFHPWYIGLSGQSPILNDLASSCGISEAQISFRKVGHAGDWVYIHKAMDPGYLIALGWQCLFWTILCRVSLLSTWWAVIQCYTTIHLDSEKPAEVGFQMGAKIHSTCPVA